VADRGQHGGGGLLDLCACASTTRWSSTPPKALNRDAVHRTVLSAHEGLVGLVASEATPLNLSDAQSHPAFLVPPGDRRRNLSFIPRRSDPARRQYARRAGGAETAPSGLMSRKRVEALQTTAMVLAEMIASGELAALAQPGAEPAARHSLHKTGAILSDGIALGHVVLHEPRVVINNYIAEDLAKGSQAARHRAGKAARRFSTACWSAATSPKAASTATCWKPTACSPTIRAGRTDCTRRSPPASPRRAAVERVAVRHPRAHAALHRSPICATACTNLEDLGHRLMRQLVGQDHAPFARAIARQTPS